MDGDFTVDEIVAAIKRVGAGKQLATSRNVATELHRLDRHAGHDIRPTIASRPTTQEQAANVHRQRD